MYFHGLRSRIIRILKQLAENCTVKKSVQISMTRALHVVEDRNTDMIKRIMQVRTAQPGLHVPVNSSEYLARTLSINAL